MGSKGIVLQKKLLHCNFPLRLQTFAILWLHGKNAGILGVKRHLEMTVAVAAAARRGFAAKPRGA